MCDTCGLFKTAMHGHSNSRLIQPGSEIFTRIAPKVEVPDVEQKPATYIVVGMLKLAEEFSKLARMADNRSKAVDEFRPQTLAADSELTLEIQADFESITEKIESILVVGPPGTITLQLGQRFWPLTIPATGVLVIAPVAILLSNSDRRQIIAQTPGDYALELMGVADERY